MDSSESLQSELHATLDAGLSSLSDKYNISLSTAARESLISYVFLLVKWNKVYNLTAVRDPVQMVQRHLLDSLVLCRWLPLDTAVAGADSHTNTRADADVIDIGSGAGLPVIPLAIARDDLRFMSIESNGKKTRFQQQALLELGLSNVSVKHQRVQDVQARARFITSRAFTAPAEFLSLIKPLCAPGASAAVMLAHTDTMPEPLPAGFRLQELVAVDIPGSQSPRHVALCRRGP